MPGFSGAQEQEPDSREPAAEPQLELGLPGDDAPGARAPATSDGGFDPHAAFTEANRLFGGGRAKGDLAQAATLYRELLQRGYHNAHIHYNLGNTYLRLDDPGRAILHFRRALLYDPDHAYASHMLERAREHVTDRFEQEEDDGTLRTLFFWHFDTSSAQRKQAFLVFWVLLWVALIAGLATRYPFRRTIQVALVVVTAATGGSLLVERLLETGDPAVLVAREVVVRSGQGDEFEPVFQAPLRGGVEVRILARRDLWRQVRFPGGAVGWVPESAVAPIVPPAG